jgi:hypothetical protein
MYKITAIKNGKEVEVTHLDFLDGTLFAVYYTMQVDKLRRKITWDFPNDFDQLEIKKIKVKERS